MLQPVKIEEIHNTVHQKLNSALYVPGRVDGISLCTEYMYNWFLRKFSKDFFKAVNLDGHDPFHDMTHWTVRDWVKRQTPKLSIVARPDIKFNRDFVDDDYNGIMGYINRTQNKNTFFKDEINNVYLGLISRLNKIDFTFKMIVRQRPEQLTVYDHLLMACRVGKTMTLYASVDFLVPDKLISRLARDLNFELGETGFPKDHTAFLNYMNKYSVLPFLLKVRGVNHRYEFFIRVTDVMVNIRDIDLDIDDGESEGMLHTNYGLEMNLTARMPSPKFFVYYSYNEMDQMVYRDIDTGELVATNLVLTPIPTRNSNNWPIYVSGDFESDNTDEPINISIYDMFKTGDGVQNDIIDTIEYCRVSGISPEIFMEIKVFNNFKEQEIYVNWNKMTLSTRTAMVDAKSVVVVYTDMEFIHNAMIEVHGYNRNRMF